MFHRRVHLISRSTGMVILVILSVRYVHCRNGCLASGHCRWDDGPGLSNPATLLLHGSGTELFQADCL